MTKPKFALNYSTFSDAELKQILECRAIVDPEGSTKLPTAPQTMIQQFREMDLRRESTVMRNLRIRALRQADSQATLRLMDLPTELRVLVYAELLHLRPSKSLAGRRACWPAILGTSRQVSKETRDVFYNENELVITINFENIVRSDRNDRNRYSDHHFLANRSEWEVTKIFVEGIRLTQVKCCPYDRFSWPTCVANMRELKIMIQSSSPTPRYMDHVFRVSSLYIKGVMKTLRQTRLDASKDYKVEFSLEAILGDMVCLVELFGCTSTRCSLLSSEAAFDAEVDEMSSEMKRKGQQREASCLESYRVFVKSIASFEDKPQPAEGVSVETHRDATLKFLKETKDFRHEHGTIPHPSLLRR